MIVDLMRNDLSRVCEKDSVVVDALCEVHDFATIRQMISTIRGRRRSDAALNELLQATFPPGSMTGAPKIAAMHWCDAQEKMERGVYSGALGWLNADTQSCDLSVVIRTLIIRKDHFEFQVGGGIVADSTPEAEWEESLLKARAICRLLQLPESRLRSL
jgi:anthranilate/para-aminobenzoate synthase component I